MIVTRVTDRLEAPTLAERIALNTGPVAPEAFHAAFAGLGALQALEVAPPPRPASAGDSARILFWNAERLKYQDESAAMLATAQADVLLLAEVDQGMARSGNRHTMALLAEALGAGYVFATEFVELDLGDARERSWHAGESNRDGLHGGGIVSAHPLARPALIRLETSGRWFDGAFGERRVGGRIAVMAELMLRQGPVLLVSVHYESHTDQDDRLATTALMLEAIDAHAPGRPVLIGGDFNTSSFTLAQKRDPAFVAAALGAEPRRLLDPVRHEPMFRLLAERGYDWAHCNRLDEVTQRTRPDGTPKPPFGRIDWLFARGLACSAPETIAAVDRKGTAISDHEALAVTIRLP